MSMDFFSYTFIQYAFIAGICIAVLAGIMGPMVVSSRQSVTSDMLAHVALAGVGFAAVFDLLPLTGAFVVLMVSSVLLWWIVTKEMYATDALAMLFLSGGLALALALIHIARDQSISFENYLFGSILTITSSELVIMVLLTVFVVVAVFFLWYPLLGAVQSPSYRIPRSTRPQVVQLVFFLLLALTVWVGIKTVGGLLVGALLVIPVLIARKYTSSFLVLTITSIAITVAGVITGLILAFYIDVPPSSVIILTLIFVFMLLGIFESVKKRFI